MTEETEPRRVPIERLCDFIERALAAVGMPGEDARTVAGLMAEADALGAEGHGIFRLPQYVRRIRAGGLNLRPDIRIERERAGMALLDGDNAMGHLVMHRAAELATRKAAEAGVAWVGAHHSNHAGPASLYARIPLRRDMIGLYVAVGNANHLPPWGGTEMLLSTNPIAIAVPAATRPPLVLDMATTVAAYGKVKTTAQRGETMPEGWMIDRQGRPLTDPRRADEGFLLPIGGYKGYGLGVMFGILAGILNGAAFGRDTIDFNADDTTPTNTGQFVVAIDIGAFTDLEAFKRQIDKVWETMKSSPLLPGVDEIRLPGERTHQVEQDNRARGVPIHPALEPALAQLAAELTIAPL
jgi:LDH2 family malate/lactate/ureidoglycolate dehydrogenase